MIIVGIELKSARGKQYDKKLGAAVIANDGTGSPTRGNYMVRLQNGRKGKLREAVVTDFPRNSRSAWELLRLALNDLARRGELP